MQTLILHSQNKETNKQSHIRATFHQRLYCCSLLSKPARAQWDQKKCVTVCVWIIILNAGPKKRKTPFEMLEMCQSRHCPPMKNNHFVTRIHTGKQQNNRTLYLTLFSKMLTHSTFSLLHFSDVFEFFWTTIEKVSTLKPSSQ